LLFLLVLPLRSQLALEEMAPLLQAVQITPPKAATLFSVQSHQLVAALVCVKALMPKRTAALGAVVATEVESVEQALLALQGKAITAGMLHTQGLVVAVVLQVREQMVFLMEMEVKKFLPETAVQEPLQASQELPLHTLAAAVAVVVLVPEEPEALAVAV
jgi:hypothetical protein